MLKPNETCLIRRKRMTITMKNNVSINEWYILRKIDFKSRKIEFYMYFVIRFKSFWSYEAMGANESILEKLMVA